MMSFRSALLLVAVLSPTVDGRRQKQAADPTLPGVGCAELKNSAKDDLVESVPGSVAAILTDKGLDNGYKNLVNDLRISRKGTLNSWKGSTLYRTMVLHKHVSVFMQQNVSLYLTKQDSEGWFGWASDSIIKVCLVDRSQQPTFIPTGIYWDGAEVDVGFGKDRMHKFPDWVTGLEFDGALQADMSEMPVNLMRLLHQRGLMVDNMKMGAMINTAEKDSLWAAKVIEDFKPKFRAKGIGLFFCGFNSKPSPRVASRYTNECPKGTAPATSEEQCRNLAIAGDLEYHGHESYSKYPAGCYKYKSYQVFYNRHSTGNRETNSAPLCSEYKNYEDSLSEKGATFKYWLEYAQLGAPSIGQDYKPMLNGTDEPGTLTEYPPTRVIAINKCMEGDSEALAVQVNKALGLTSAQKGQCGKVAGAVIRDSKEYPDCKCEDEMQVHCGKQLVSERKFNMNTVMSIAGCSEKTAYCAKRPCMITKASTEM